MAKITKTQRETLRRIWTERMAVGLVKADERSMLTAINAATARKEGYSKLNGNSHSSLADKGLIIDYVTKTKVECPAGTFLIRVAVLTEAGRAALGV